MKREEERDIWDQFAGYNSSEEEALQENWNSIHDHILDDML
jgi:hypothetical protein